MEKRPYGATGLEVSAIGLGAGHIGGADMDERDVERLLHGALDRGVTLIDTAPSYGLSEERIGRHLAGRRDAFVLSTKGGYGDFGVPEWTGACVARGIDAALARLRTDRLDVFHLHSCPREVLGREDILRSLEDARSAGKVRVAAYSGENEHLAAALAIPLFGGVQCSVNICDQRALDAYLPGTRAGVIGKRPLANACWRFAERPTGQYAEVYWDRFHAMGMPSWDVDWPEVAIRFSAFAPGVSSVIVGTRSLEHLRRSADAVAKGPLEPELVTRIRAGFQGGWAGEV